MANSGAKLFESDLYLLKELFFPHLKVGVFFDPDHAIWFNYETDFPVIENEETLKHLLPVASDYVLIKMTNRQIDDEITRAFGGVISLQKEVFNGHEMPVYFTLGRYDMFRYLYPKTLKKPLFYQVLHENYDYSWHSRMFDSICMKTGLHRYCSAGSLFLYSKEPIELKIANRKSDCFFLFADNFIYNSVISAFFVEENEIVEEIKLADGEKGMAALANEMKVLKFLNHSSLKFDLLSIPKLKKEGLRYLVIENNWPKKIAFNDLIEPIHLRAMTELYDNSLEVCLVKDFLLKHNILGLIKVFKRMLDESLQPKGLSAEHIEVLCLSLITLINKLNPFEPVYHALYHGQFRPQFAAISMSHMYLNNWQNASPQMPLLFDFFDFIFAKVEKLEMPDLVELDDVMKHFIKKPATMDLVRKFELRFKVHLALYQIYHVVTQLEKFVQQRYIHPNANFKLKFWIEGLDRLSNNEL